MKELPCACLSVLGFSSRPFWIQILAVDLIFLEAEADQLEQNKTSKNLIERESLEEKERVNRGKEWVSEEVRERWRYGKREGEKKKEGKKRKRKRLSLDEKRRLCLVCVSGTGRGGRERERERKTKRKWKPNRLSRLPVFLVLYPTVTNNPFDPRVVKGWRDRPAIYCRRDLSPAPVMTSVLLTWRQCCPN